MSDKKNCWEVMRCGREPGGANGDRHGVCPAASDQRFDQVHGGKNAGRACWAIAGTLCGSFIQGSYAKDIGNCMVCPFFLQVAKEEGARFIPLRKLVASIHTASPGCDVPDPNGDENISNTPLQKKSSFKA